MARKKKADLLKAKQRKQKIFVAIGGVALLAAAAFEVPMIMGGGGEAAPPPPPAETSTVTPGATSAPTSFAPPTPGATGAAPAAGIGQLVDTDLPALPTQTRLVGFSLFESKDPFVQQISASGGSTDSDAEGATATTTGSQPGVEPGAEPGKSSGADVPGSTAAPGSGDDGVVPPSGTSTGVTGGTAPAPAKTVTLTVNGKQERVGVGGTFPQGSPTFRLVSCGKGTAEIGVVGGTYAAGGQTVTLKQGVPLTLVNTTDDTRYRLVLVKTP